MASPQFCSQNSMRRKGTLAYDELYEKAVDHVNAEIHKKLCTKPIAYTRAEKLYLQFPKQCFKKYKGARLPRRHLSYRHTKALSDGAVQAVRAGVTKWENTDNNHGKQSLPNRSLTGLHRLDLSANKYLVKDDVNLYFADYWKNRRETCHYVDVIAAKDGTESDLLCANHLRKLQNDSPFVKRDFTPKSRKVKVPLNSIIWVNIQFTESFKIEEKDMKNLTRVLPFDSSMIEDDED